MQGTRRSDWTRMAFAGLVLLTSSTVLAQAPPKSDDVTALKQQGNEAMASLRPSDAIVAYRKAYELSKEPALLYNMGRASEAIGDYPAALAQYAQFQREAPPELKARIPKLDELVADIRSRVTQVTIRCNVAGARVLVRDAALGEVPTSGVLEQTFSAGPATVEVIAEGYASYREQATLTRGGSATFDVRLVPKTTAGILAIETSPVSGMVFVDDKPIGRAPVEDTVTAGAHRIVVRHEGYPDTETQMIAQVGQIKHLTVKLEKSPLIVTRWWFWTGVGVIATGGAVLLYAAFKTRSADNGSLGQTSAPLVRF